MEPSDEQLAIINAVGAGNNVVVDAVAGSGKTTTVLGLAARFPDLSIIQIAYNAALKIEVRRKVAEAALANVEVHTFHSLAYKYYKEKVIDDRAMERLFITDAPIKSLPRCDVLVIDEIQDMRSQYFRLIQKFLRDTELTPNLLLLGDKYQEIYAELLGSDSRFLTLANTVWPQLCERPAVELTLRQSYRLTTNMARFVNENMLGTNRIIAPKPGGRVIYMRYVSLNIATSTLGNLCDKIHRGKIAPSDVFVIVPSLKGKNHHYKKLENHMVSLGIGCYVPNSDFRELDETLMMGKVVYTTIHQSKGRERKYVIVYNFDDSYYEFYARDLTRSAECPNILYVAATRAAKRLYLITSAESRDLCFLKESPNDEHIRFYPCKYGFSKSDTPITRHSNMTPTELVKYIKDRHLDALIEAVNKICIKIAEPSIIVNVPLKTRTTVAGGVSEDITALNGIAIVEIIFGRKYDKWMAHAYVASQIRGNMDIARDLKVRYPILAKIDKLIAEKTLDSALETCNIFMSASDRLLNRIAQIDEFDWLIDAMIDGCAAHLDPYISREMVLEKEIGFGFTMDDKMENFEKLPDEEKNPPFTIMGRLDGEDAARGLEIKCVEEITLEHKLQAIVYVWMSRMDNPAFNKPFYLVNIRSGEAYMIAPDRGADINAVMTLLFRNQYEVIKKISDGAFIAKCAEIVRITYT